MKQPTMKCTRWQSQLLIRLLCLTAAMLFCVPSAQSQIPRSLPEVPVGGPGGGEFVARCPPGQFLGGVELRAGDDVDAIRPLCRTPLVTEEKVLIRPHYDIEGNLIPEHYESMTTVGVRGDATASTDWYGGSGGGIKFLVCPSARPIVSAIYVEAEGVKTVIVNRITLLCEVLTYGAPSEFRDRKFWQDIRSDDPSVMNFEAPKNSANEISGTNICPVSQNGYATLAVGIRGRSGVWLDALGLICDYAKLPPKSAPPPDAPPKPVVKLEGRVKLPPTDAPTDAPPVSICERAREARARNSPAAPGLEAQCRAVGEDFDVNALAAKGEAIANADPLSAELRNQQPDDPSRRGFDIGMAAAEGQTLPGPRKQRIHDALSQAEQRGFETALAFSLERNRNADLAAKGAAIAQADPSVAEARTMEADVFYQLGFDIATGIFGDPALGAQGNTAVGPGSLKIRDSLSPAGQRGFNAAVKFHLSRNYRP